MPIWGEILADFDTPVSALKKIESGDYAFLLESVEGGAKWGRYSFLGADPSLIFRSKGNQIEIVEHGTVKKQEGNPIEYLRQILSRYRPVISTDLPRFHGGAVGYFGYDIVRFFEKLPEIGRDDLGLWDSLFMITDSVLVFDNISHKIKIISNAFVSDNQSAKKTYNEAVGKIEGIIEKLRSPVSPYKAGERKLKSKSHHEFKSNFEPKEFMEAVKRTKEYIQAGDIIQAVISQRWKIKLDISPFDLYRALRILNPSPYMFYLKMGEDFLVGSSPEVMVRVEGDRLESRPIAGTRPRGSDEKEDVLLQEELLSDPKERAEHIMLVDLARNDLGRVAKVGTVKVNELMTVEKYSHV
ncbi:MAG TPA: chorismate-binding protein, partial [Thermodesulfobacteriota bacterium]